MLYQFFLLFITKMFIRDFYSFLKSPTLDLNSDEVRGLKQCASNLANGYVTYLVLAIGSFLFLKIIDTAILKHCYGISIMSQFDLARQKTMLQLAGHPIFFIVVLGPLAEEVLFRLPLNFEKTSIGISLALISYRVSGGHLRSFDVSSHSSYIRIGLILLVFALLANFTPRAWLEKIKRNYFKHFFYLSAILFGLVHVSNFAPYDHAVLFFYPLYTLPQFFLGLIAGYLRIRHGFLLGWALHAIVNLPPALLALA